MTKDIWKDPEFCHWYEQRPPRVQEAIRAHPPDKLYRIYDGAFPAQLYSYDEDKDGNVTVKVDILSPFLPRRVFGVSIDDLEEWDGDEPKPLATWVKLEGVMGPRVVYVQLEDLVAEQISENGTK